jgi:hypothetical protein
MFIPDAETRKYNRDRCHKVSKLLNTAKDLDIVRNIIEEYRDVVTGNGIELENQDNYYILKLLLETGMRVRACQMTWMISLRNDDRRLIRLFADHGMIKNQYSESWWEVAIVHCSQDTLNMLLEYAIPSFNQSIKKVMERKNVIFKNGKFSRERLTNKYFIEAIPDVESARDCLYTTESAKFVRRVYEVYPEALLDFTPPLTLKPGVLDAMKECGANIPDDWETFTIV